MNDRGLAALIIGFPGAVATEAAAAICAEGRLVLLMATPREVAGARAWVRDREGMEVVEGDRDKIDFGLSGARYLELASRIRSIHYLVSPCIDGGEDPVGEQQRAARELIELATVARLLEVVVVLSHLDVAGQHEGVFTEADLDLGQKFASPDQRARFVFERIIRRFTDKLPLVFLRPGWTMGAGEQLCPVSQILLASADPMPKQAPGRLILTDIGSLTKIIPRLDVDRPLPGGTTLHLAAQPCLHPREMLELVNETAAGLVPPGYDLAAGARRVLKRTEGEARWSARELYKRQAPMAKFSFAHTSSLLRERGLEAPRLDRDRLVPLVERAVEEIVGFR